MLILCDTVNLVDLKGVAWRATGWHSAVSSTRVWNFITCFPAISSARNWVRGCSRLECSAIVSDFEPYLKQTWNDLNVNELEHTANQIIINWKEIPQQSKKCHEVFKIPKSYFSYLIGTLGGCVPYLETLANPYEAINKNWKNVTKSPQPGENLKWTIKNKYNKNDCLNCNQYFILKLD